MSKYIVSLDQGTTSSRCILFDHERQNCQRGAERVYSDLSKSRMGGA